MNHLVRLGHLPCPRTLYHPYSQDGAALTQYLKRKLREQRAKQLSCSHIAHVEQNVPLERNINSDLPTLAATILERIDRKGECNVPKRYIKNADWIMDPDAPLGPGYYVGNPDDEEGDASLLISIDFNFKALQWGLTYKKDDHFVVERPAPVRYRLCIFDEE